jgi:site-specific recombinase XerD
MPDLIARYLERLELKNFSKHTLRGYELDLRQAERALSCKLVDASEDLIEAYVSGLSRAGLTGTTVRRKQASLRGFFKHCIRVKALTVDPTTRFEPPKVEERLPIYMNTAQVAQLLEALRHETWEECREAAIVACLYYTGMRSCELVGLTINDLLLDDRAMRVFGKGKRERTLPVPEALDRHLRAWLAVHPTGKGPLFVTTRKPHERLRYDGVDRVVKAAIARAGLAGRKFSCHKLRHTFATRLINRKVGIEKIQKLLGHRRIDTTQLYAHARAGNDMLDELDGAL